MQFTLSTGMFRAWDLPALLPLFRQAGFERLEITDNDDFDDASLATLIKDAGECGLTMPNWHLIQHPPFERSGVLNRSAIERVKRSIDQGAALGAKNHILHWDNRFADRGNDTLWRESIDCWTEHARRQGVRLLMETVPDKPTNERYVSSSEIIEFVRTYPAEVLAMCVDVNHSNLQEDLDTVLHTVHDRLVSLHISDNDGEAEKHWLPGQGVIDFPSLFDSLSAIEFDGLFVFEVNRWCDEPGTLSKLRQLHAFGMSLLETGRPHADTPALSA